ncbi:amidohydrolase family protein [Flavobacteriaceae bacterium]|nr:amidohydrolase family protein [Flavobacteriaceae bacterium]
MKIDSHLHFDYKNHNNLQQASKELQKQLSNQEFSKGVVINMAFEPWTIEDFSSELSNHNNLIGIINIDPNDSNCLMNLEYAIRNLGYLGMKLHPRLHNFDLLDPQVIKLCNYAEILKIPVIIDAFPDGTFLLNGYKPIKYARLAEKAPKTKFVWAHMGGHDVIEFMLYAKRLKNVYLDTSYSILYYQESSLCKNFIYAMKSMKFNKIFYGSDYPDRSIKNTFNQKFKIFRKYGVSEAQMEKLFFKNSYDFFQF